MLKKSTWFPQYAVENIPVVKMLARCQGKGMKRYTRYCTPFTFTEITNNYLKGKKIWDRIVSIFFSRYVDKGFVHCFSPNVNKEIIKKYGYLDVVMIKAYIPQGSLYYVDKDGVSMAATKIVFCDRRIKTYLSHLQ